MSMMNFYCVETAAVRAADNAHTANAATLAAADAPACCTSSLHPRCRRKKPAARRDQSSAKGWQSCLDLRNRKICLRMLEKPAEACRRVRKHSNSISRLSSLLYPLWYSRFIGGQAEYLTPRCPRSKLSIRISKRKGLALRCDSHYADAD